MSRHATAEQLSSYVDRELVGPRLRLVEKHLEECDECRRRLDGMRRVVVGLRRLEQLEPPPMLGQDLARRVRLEPRPRDLVQRLEDHLRGTPLQSTVGFTFALIFALAVILYLFSGWVERQGLSHQPILVAPSEVAGAAGHRRIGNRLFHAVEGEWHQVGVIAADAVVVAADGETVRDLLAREPALAPLVAEGAPVILEVRDPAAGELRVLEILPPPPQP